MFAPHADTLASKPVDGIKSYKVYNPFARRHLTQPLAPKSVATVKQGETIVIGENVETNDQRLWMDPSLH